MKIILVCIKISEYTSLLTEEGLEKIKKKVQNTDLIKFQKIYPKISLFHFFLIKYGIVSKKNTFNNLVKIIK